MRHKLINNKNYDYWKETQKPYPKRINWEVVTPRGAELTSLQDHDIVFDSYDMRIRQLVI